MSGGFRLKWMGKLPKPRPLGKGSDYRKWEEKKPEQLVYNAVKGMMAKNALNRHALNRLKIYNTSEHPHEAQKPKQLSL